MFFKNGRAARGRLRRLGGPGSEAGAAGGGAALQGCDWTRASRSAGALRSRWGRTFLASGRKMRTHQVLACLLLLMATSMASENASTSRGCGLDLLPQYVSLCDLDAVWGIVVEAVAGAGALITLLLMFILMVRLPCVRDKEKRKPACLLFLFLLGTLGLFGLTFAFIIRMDETICSVRRFLWGVLFALCFSCLLSLTWHVRRLVRQGSSPAGWQLVSLALCLMMVQVIIATEWLVLTVLRDTKPSCAYEPMDFVMALIYDMVLLAAALGSPSSRCVASSTGGSSMGPSSSSPPSSQCSSGWPGCPCTSLATPCCTRKRPGTIRPWPSHWWPAAGSLSSSMPSLRSTAPSCHPCRKTHPTILTQHTQGCDRQHSMTCTCHAHIWRTKPSQWTSKAQLAVQQDFPMAAWGKSTVAA